MTIHSASPDPAKLQPAEQLPPTWPPVRASSTVGKAAVPAPQAVIGGVVTPGMDGACYIGCEAPLIAQLPPTWPPPAGDIGGGGGGVPEAPTDGQQYGRQSSTWTPIAAGGGGVPGGATTQVQFNDGGTFGGAAGLTFDKATNKLTALYVDETVKGGVTDGVHWKLEFNYLNAQAELKDVVGAYYVNLRVKQIAADFSSLGSMGQFFSSIYFMTHHFDLWPCINVSPDYSYGWSATTANVPPDTALRRHAPGIISANATTVTMLDPESIELPERPNDLPNPQTIDYQSKDGAFLSGRFILCEGVVEPVAMAGYTQLYVDVAGSVKIKTGDGTVLPLSIPTAVYEAKIERLAALVEFLQTRLASLEATMEGR